MKKIYILALIVCFVLSSCSSVRQTINENNIENKDEEITDVSYYEDVVEKELVLFPFINSEGKMGYIDENGNEIIEPVYKTAENFSEGFAVVQDYLTSRKFYIDVEGNKVFDSDFQDAFSFSEGVAVTYDNNEMLVIDYNGTIIFTKDNISYAEEYSNGLLLFMSENRNYGYIDKNGEIVVEPTYNNALKFSDGLAAVQSNEGYINYLDTEGNIALETSYVYDVLIENFNFKDGLACVVNEVGKYGYIDKNGIVKIDFIYNYADEFFDGYAAVQLSNGMFTFINYNGERIFENEFYGVCNFSEGIAGVYDGADHMNAKLGFISDSGELIIDYKYDHGYSAHRFVQADNYMNNGLIYVRKFNETENWIGYINAKDEVIYNTSWNSSFFY